MDKTMMDRVDKTGSRAGIVGKAILFGPLIGGAPYNWLLFPVLFSYLLGFVPALLGGLLFAWWLDPAANLAKPGIALGAVVGALCGTAGCWLSMGLLGLRWTSDFGLPDLIARAPIAVAQTENWLFVAHGTFAGAVLGGFLGRTFKNSRIPVTERELSCAS
jgi:hypothetical protein